MKLRTSPRGEGRLCRRMQNVDLRPQKISKKATRCHTPKGKSRPVGHNKGPSLGEENSGGGASFVRKMETQKDAVKNKKGEGPKRRPRKQGRSPSGINWGRKDS